MENKKPENPNAFPNTNPEYFGAEGEHGMTLRDYFAAKALEAIFIKSENEPYFKAVAKISYQMADAMLKERSNTP